MKPVGRLEYFRSRIDQSMQPCVVCETGPPDEPRPVVVEVTPGGLENPAQGIELTEEIAGIAAKHDRPCIALRPGGRGPGSVYQNYGEVDVLEALEHLGSTRLVDRDRIGVTGMSMGGAATWYLASHYPDLFAGAVPFCGYCDYRLWEKPGGSTFHMHPWEEPSWRSRSAALLAANLSRTPVWIVHGEWDRAIGGGVSVEHSRQMARLLHEQGAEYRYTEVPETGHACRTPEILEQAVLWLLDQRKSRHPSDIRLVTHGLRHNRSEWVCIEQFQRYGEPASVDASLSGDTLRAHTSNVRALTLGPFERTVRLEIDGQSLGMLRHGTYRHDAAWAPGEPGAGEKRHGSSGPIGDMFFDGTVFVPGTAGSDQATFMNHWAATDAARFFRTRNGGVHRGGIMGESTMEFPVVADTDLDAALQRNILLFGNLQSNAAVARIEGRIPMEVADGTLRLGDRTYTGQSPAAFAVFPHPDIPERYVAVHGGVTDDAICWGSHLDMALLPDFIVYDRGHVLDWGFWDSDWRGTGSSADWGSRSTP